MYMWGYNILHGVRTFYLVKTKSCNFIMLENEFIVHDFIDEIIT